MVSPQVAETGISMMSRALRGAVLATAMAFATGCSTLNAPSGPASTNLSPRPLASSFTASGRVAARVTGDNARGFSGGFSWIHRADGDTIELLTPLGQIAARMQLSRNGASIELPDGRQTQTADPEQFLSDAFGVSLPLAALPNWFQAVPLAGKAYRAETDSLGRPSMLWQDGWEIEYTDYVSASAGANPTRLQLRQGNVEARMIISEWSAP